MSNRRLAHGAWLLLALAACGRKPANPFISAAGYDHACTASSDCEPVYEGALQCCGGQCANAAIRADATNRYARDTQAHGPMCTGTERCPPIGACPGSVVTCPHGVCEYHSWDLTDKPDERAVTAADYDRACATVADCKAVYEGALGCCNLGCPNAAIRQDAFAQYDKDVGARTPHCTPIAPCVPLPPCTDGRIACDNGLCTLLSPSPDASAD